jgi:hypothetical protein
VQHSHAAALALHWGAVVQEPRHKPLPRAHHNRALRVGWVLGWLSVIKRLWWVGRTGMQAARRHSWWCRTVPRQHCANKRGTAPGSPSPERAPLHLSELLRQFVVVYSKPRVEQLVLEACVGAGQRALRLGRGGARFDEAPVRCVVLRCRVGAGPRAQAARARC